MSSVTKFLIEIVIVGLMTTIIGLLVSYALMGKERDNFKHWKTVMLGYFATGCLVHLGCELSQINKWYCKHGNACLS